MRQLKKYVPRELDRETLESELTKLYRAARKGDEDPGRAAHLAALLIALYTVKQPREAA